MDASLQQSLTSLGYEVSAGVRRGKSLLDLMLVKEGVKTLVIQREEIQEADISYLKGVGESHEQRWIITNAPPSSQMVTFCHRMGIRIVSQAEILAEAHRKSPSSQGGSLSRPAVRDARNVFVVHGRDLEMKEQLGRLLRAFGLLPVDFPTATRNTGKSLPFIAEVLDYAFTMCNAVVVLLTPDDEGRVRQKYLYEDDSSEERDYNYQPRLNVIFEAGVAMGRHPERTVLVRTGRMRLFSDIAGRHLVHLKNSRESREELGRRLEAAGCPVQWNSRTWLRAGKFALAMKACRPDEAQG